MQDFQKKENYIRFLDIVFIIGAIIILIVFTTIYQMPFRLDDVLHMDWAREHSFWDAFDVQRGEIVRSVRPVFAMTIWILTHTAGINNYFPWHLTLVGSFLIGLAYAGKTARYISQEQSALYFTTGFFWLAFLPILNMLFWYGDLTFTLELMFVAPAWYYGLRGLLEGKLGLWMIAIIAGILAVLAKEPALLLVHSVFACTFVFCFSDIKKAWQGNSKFSKFSALILYLLFLGISLKLYFASPTRSNRFFNIGTLSHEQLMFFINDRLRYYGETLLNPIARILLISPLLYSIIRHIKRGNKMLLFSVVLIICSCLISFFFVKSLPILFGILIITPIINIIREKERRLHILLIAFFITAMIILAVLLITVMLVKTQLAELSFVLLVISGVYWAELIKEIIPLIKPYWIRKKIKYSLILSSIFLFMGSIYAAFPIIKAKERLLGDVRDVRNNANNAIKWMGAHLPPNSTLAVAGPSLYGLGAEDEMTSKNDEYKLYAQYTFIQGYIRSYFRALERTDISLAYLEDSVKLSGVLDALRNQHDSYLFLQTGLDGDRFHSLISGKRQLIGTDSLLIKFTDGPFPTEIWKLGN